MRAHRAELILTGMVACILILRVSLSGSKRLQLVISICCFAALSYRLERDRQADTITNARIAQDLTSARPWRLRDTASGSQSTTIDAWVGIWAQLDGFHATHPSFDPVRLVLADHRHGGLWAASAVRYGTGIRLLVGCDWLNQPQPVRSALIEHLLNHALRDDSRRAAAHNALHVWIALLAVGLAGIPAASVLISVSYLTLITSRRQRERTCSTVTAQQPAHPSPTPAPLPRAVTLPRHWCRAPAHVG
jgi:hypothetical protein